MTESRKVCVITGASSGIGQAAAIRFSNKGFFVVLLARRENRLRETLLRCNGNGRVLVCDVSDRNELRSAAQSIIEQESRCDVLVNNAGVGARREFSDADALEVLDTVMDTNFFSAARMTHHLLDLLKQSRGVVINVSSVAGSLTTPKSPLYCASKFAMKGLSEGLQQQLNPFGVAVKNVQPGPVVTEGWSHSDLKQRWSTRWLAIDADRVAKDIVAASRHNARPDRLIPRYWRIGVVIHAVLPSFYRRLTQRTVPKASSSD